MPSKGTSEEAGGTTPIQAKTMEPVKIQILSSKCPELQDAIDKVIQNISILQNVAEKHGIRSLLVSSYRGEGDYDLKFGIRMRDDSYDGMRFQKFSREFEDRTGLTSVCVVHSPDNLYIKNLSPYLMAPYEDLLGESALSRKDILDSRDKAK